nr:protein FAR1-RELATED SEQUENCE 5-like [Ipomoea batatas]
MIGEITMKYLVCRASRQGFKGCCCNKLKIREEGDDIITKQRRRRTSNRVGCNAKVSFRKVETGEYLIAIFEEKHNHSLCSKAAKLFMKVDENNHLSRLFWYDPIARCNFSNFGDIVSFDATYGTNKYAATLLVQVHCCCTVFLVSFSRVCIHVLTLLRPFVYCLCIAGIF